MQLSLSILSYPDNYLQENPPTPKQEKISEKNCKTKCKKPTKPSTTNNRFNKWTTTDELLATKWNQLPSKTAIPTFFCLRVLFVSKHWIRTTLQPYTRLFRNCIFLILYFCTPPNTRYIFLQTPLLYDHQNFNHSPILSLSAVLWKYIVSFLFVFLSPIVCLQHSLFCWVACARRPYEFGKPISVASCDCRRRNFQTCNLYIFSPVYSTHKNSIKKWKNF